MRATDLPPRAYESRCACSCSVPWRATSSSSGSSRLGRTSSPRAAASSCCVRCGHSRKPVRSLALRISRPSVRCMRTPRSRVELQLLRARVGLSRRTRPDHRQHVADAITVGGPEEQLGHAGKLAGVMRKMLAGEIAVRAAALEAEAAERGDGGLAQAARLRHPVLRAHFAEHGRVMDYELDVALGVSRILEDHEVVIAQVEEQPAEL